MIFLSLYLSSLLTHNPPWCRTTVRPCDIVFPRNNCCLSSLWTFHFDLLSFISLFVWCFPLFFTFCWLCVNLLCMYTHFPWLPVHWCTSRHKGLVLSELQMLSGGFPLLWRADDDRSSIGFGVFPDQTVVLLTPRVSDKPVWTSPK